MNNAVKKCGLLVFTMLVTTCVAAAQKETDGPVEAKRPLPANSVKEKKAKASGIKKKAAPGEKPKFIRLGEADKKWLDDPFLDLEGEMFDVVTDLEDNETRRPAEKSQPRILSKLDTLVRMLEKSCKGGGAGRAGAFPTRPANSSTLAGGPGGKGKMRDPDKSRRKWADLTPKQREKILQSRTEGFPPGYEDLLADYFRRLSKGKPVDLTAPAGKKAK